MLIRELQIEMFYVKLYSPNGKKKKKKVPSSSLSVVLAVSSPIAGDVARVVRAPVTGMLPFGGVLGENS